MYVNDIPDLVNSKIKMFADDIKIYTQVTSFSDVLFFQNDLDKLCGWARKWLLRFNIANCKHLKYGTNTSPYKYYMNDDGSNSKLSVVPSEKDLGVWITSKPDFSLQCDKTSAKSYAIPRANKKNFYQLDKRIISNTLQDICSPTPRILCFNLESISSKEH